VYVLGRAGVVNGNSRVDIGESLMDELREEVMRTLCGLFIAAVFATFFFVAKASAQANKDQEASQLASKANQLMDICSPGSPPFRLTEEVRVWTKKSKWVEGTYTLIWKSADQWKDELMLPDYHEIRIGGQQLIWLLRSQAHWTAAALEARPFANVPRITARASDYAVKRIYKKKTGDATSLCFSGRPIRTVGAEDCFDANRGFFLNSTDRAGGRVQRIEFGEYFSLGKHFMPRQRRRFRNHELIAETNVRDASLIQDVDPTMFVPPTGATRIGGCQNPVLPKPITMPNPAYSAEARKAHVNGTVALEVQIDAHGLIESVTVVESLTPDLDRTALETIKNKWRFEPATCSGTPVPFETTVEVDFRTLL
jgi:protein TonB